MEAVKSMRGQLDIRRESMNVMNVVLSSDCHVV